MQGHPLRRPGSACVSTSVAPSRAAGSDHLGSRSGRGSRPICAFRRRFMIPPVFRARSDHQIGAEGQKRTAHAER